MDNGWTVIRDTLGVEYRRCGHSAQYSRSAQIDSPEYLSTSRYRPIVYFFYIWWWKGRDKLLWKRGGTVIDSSCLNTSPPTRRSTRQAAPTPPANPLDAHSADSGRPRVHEIRRKQPRSWDSACVCAGREASKKQRDEPCWRWCSSATKTQFL